ncbi:2-methoxy-6-polyprenyl-1,4-benzoquinol methylase [Fistulifera solaris]|uniref:2-methoxy-6-polyprenyl-1,4-benzoquinol methylase, mitochondrial n=1 Tax=Fistulifera solaris TaxID=1519565 RepID=A0A1Z5J973_FISSO|nr:2-methoxy-6-polyprenyl-1,4-benzoquinol methylase [Fistulifera solaris]|eukprot:GAX10506.1 2-methoxy-6-polyprenyl-1,4-benzoquinol methylase [Fistulifera solaris]
MWARTIRRIQVSQSAQKWCASESRLSRRRNLSTSFDSKAQPYVSGSSTHFGYEEVSVNEKESRVREVFDSVADSYDVMNDLMSSGLHRYWKDYLLQISAVESMAKAVRRSVPIDQTDNYPLLHILDVAGGTGDVAFRFVEAANCVERSKSSGKDPIRITVCDINAEMLQVGEHRARAKFGNSILDDSEALHFQQGNAQDLCDFADCSFDLYTIAFGLRNVTDVDKALSEAHRVLKPGGRFMCLEFSHVPNPILRPIYDAYSFNVIPAMGEFIANDRHSYQYLVESIRMFSNQDELVLRMQQAGFQHVKYTNLTGGIVAIHEGWKDVETSI